MQQPSLDAFGAEAAKENPTMAANAAAKEIAAKTPTAAPATPVYTPPAYTPTASAPTTPTRSAVDAAYQSTFGRPADEVGANYWMDQANKTPGFDLTSAIKGGAQGMDVTARNDIAAGGVDTTKTWGNGASLASPDLKYDAANNTWGLLNATTPTTTATAVPTTTITPATFPNVTAATATPAVQDPTKGTVAGQIDAIIGKNSALMQRAEQKGLDLANTRGLLNSGMAVESAQNAVYDAAMPIAQADAASSNQFALTNAGETNQTSRTNAQFANQASLAQAEMANQAALQTLRGDQAQQLSATEAQYRTQIQTSASAASFYASIVQHMTASQTASGTTAEQKDAAANYYNQSLRNGMAIISSAGGRSNTDLSSLLNFTGA